MNSSLLNYQINFAIFTGEFVCGSAAINTITKGFMKNYFKNKYGSDKFGVVSNRSSFLHLLQQVFQLLGKALQ